MPSTLTTEPIAPEAVVHGQQIGPDPHRAALLERERLRPVPKRRRNPDPPHAAAPVRLDPAHVTQQRRAALLAALRSTPT